MGKFFKKILKKARPTELTHTTYSKSGKVKSKVQLKGDDAAAYMRGFMEITDKSRKMANKGKFIKKAFDSKKNLIPQVTYPDGTVPEYSLENSTWANNQSKPKPPVIQKNTYFSAVKPNLPTGPRHESVLTINPSTLVASLPGNWTPSSTSHFAAATKPNLPTGPTHQSVLTVDPTTLIATVGTGSPPPGVKPPPGSPGMQTLDYWLADYSLRQERGLHHPRLRPVAAARQKLKDKGFKIHTKGDKPAQVAGIDPESKAAKTYQNVISNKIQSAGVRV